MLENVEIQKHPTEQELSDLLDGSIAPEDRKRLEGHIALCDECLAAISSAYDAVSDFKRGRSKTDRWDKNMGKINIYLTGTIIAFILSFLVPRFFMQFLVASAILGMKWVVDSKTSRMLVMIYEAWKKGGEEEASRVLKNIDQGSKMRF